jgi:hypothetical protein
MRRTRLITPALVLALAAAATAAAASKDPRKLVLQRSDVPAGAKLIASLSGSRAAVSGLDVSARTRAALVRSRHYAASYSIPPATGFDHGVSSYVYVLGSTARAQRTYAALAKPTKGVKVRRAPRLGDQQMLGVQRGGATYLVRRGAVIWMVAVFRLKGAVSTREALGYARKEQARVE